MIYSFTLWHTGSSKNGTTPCLWKKKITTAFGHSNGVSNAGKQSIAYKQDKFWLPASVIICRKNTIANYAYLYISAVWFEATLVASLRPQPTHGLIGLPYEGSTFTFSILQVVSNPHSHFVCMCVDILGFGASSPLHRLDFKGAHALGFRATRAGIHTA